MMNLTFRLMTDLGDFPEYVLWTIIVFVVLCVGWLYLGLRFVMAFESLVDHYAKRGRPSAISSYRYTETRQTKSQSGQGGKTPQEDCRSELKVPEISPEAILRRAPKPTGFDGAGDGNKQS